MADAEVQVKASSTPSKGPSPAFLRNLTANAEMCVSCNKRVYATERLGTGDVVYHKACFRCAHCNKALSLGQYTIGENKPYCKPHYLRNFKQVGSYNFSDHKPSASTAGSTPYMVRQRSSDIVQGDRADVVRSPQVTFTGRTTVETPTSPLSPVRSPSLIQSTPDSDSVGNVKRLTSFAATRAMFENSSFTSTSNTSTPSSKTTTPSKGFVSEMRAKREAASVTPDTASTPPVSSRPKESEPVTTYNDKDKDQKTDEKEKEEDRHREQEVEERDEHIQRTEEEPEPEEQKMEERELIVQRSEDKEEEHEPLEQEVEEPEQIVQRMEDRQEEPGPVEQRMAEREQLIQMAEDRQEDEETAEEKLEEPEQQNVLDEDQHHLVEIQYHHDEDELGKKQPQPLIDFGDDEADDNLYDDATAVVDKAQPEVPAAFRDDDDDDDDKAYVVDQPPKVSASFHADDYDKDDNADYVMVQKTDETDGGSDDGADIDGKEQPKVSASFHVDYDVIYDDAAAATAVDADNDDDDPHHRKYSDKDDNDNDVTAQHQQQQQNGGYDDVEYI